MNYKDITTRLLRSKQYSSEAIPDNLVSQFISSGRRRLSAHLIHEAMHLILRTF